MIMKPPSFALRLLDAAGIALVYLYARLWHRLTCHSYARVPPQGPAIVISNHTCSADPAFLTAACPRRLSFIVGIEYYRIPLLWRLFNYLECVPVTRNGRDAKAALVALRRLRANQALCIFPEGGLSNAGRHRLGRCKAGASFLALKSGAPVYPAYISGGPQTSNIGRAWLWPSRVSVRFGPAIDLTAYAKQPMNRKLLEDVSRVLMRHVAALALPSTADHLTDASVNTRKPLGGTP
jgi:1-acyl-sn-glycerol-3-phosphate acyltransferase